jgi:chemosensory pili system protein ChpA (sensor histidine kinase/response regulator)
MDRAMQEWTAEPASRAPLPGLERTLHTLKGGARLSGIAPIGDLSHNFESLLTSVDQERVAVDEYVIDLAQRVADRLVNQIDQVSEARRVRRADDLLEELEAAIAGRPVGIVGGPVEPAEAAAEEEAPRAAAPAAEDASRVLQFPDRGLAAPHAEREGGRGIHAVTQAKSRPSALPRSSQEQVRVRAETLDRLVNNAGEVSIYRARLEQQNGALGFNLTELDQTVSRLRQQLRQLEIETEAQILFRYERDQEEAGVEYDEDFDPLEMDRFSTIQQLSRSLAETVNDLVSIRDIMDDLNRQTETLLLQQSRITTDLQDGLLRTRMVPFSTLVPRMHRLVRQTSGQLGKRAQLEVFGADSEMDRSILERMVAPLEHILRNAVSHGIESPEIRREHGKDETGRVSIYLSREGNDVLLTVSDDGGGLRLDAIRGKAIERGLLADGAIVSDDDLIQFIMEHGFSTSDVVTQISGRGVGMDVVVSEVKQLGGAVEIDSQEGRGSSFTVRLPLTLAITDALLVELSEEIYAVPHTSIQGVVRASRQAIEDCYARRREGIEYAGHLYSVRYLGSILDTGPLVLPEQTKWLPLLLVRAGEHRVALQVDALVGNRQIVVKSVGPQLSSVRWVTGGTILPDGRVALILDVNALVRMAAMQDLSAAEQPTPEELGEGVTVMVVDDSITVRKVTSRLLERHNMNVLTAKDGVDAVAKLQEQVPDVMLLDIEMPRMDGYELARHMRNSPDLANVPIIMITSRTGEKHRTRAFELGVNRYLGKPYQETDLLENIYSLLAEKQT